MSGKVVLITGATGFIGSNLARHFQSAGYIVRGLVRSMEEGRRTLPSVSLYEGSMPQKVDPLAFREAEIVIHCAYTTRFRGVKEAHRVNDEGTRLVVRRSREAGAKKIIFLSSLSARADAESYYGRSKFDLEKLFDPNNDTIVRAGLVVGSGNAGLFTRMVESIQTSPFIPLFDGGNQIIQVVHVEDLCSVLRMTVEHHHAGIITVADPVGIALREFLALIAERVGTKKPLVSIPSAPVLMAVRTLERLRIPFPISSENILGLRSLQFVECADDLRRLGLTLRTPRECIEQIFPKSRDQ